MAQARARSGDDSRLVELRHLRAFVTAATMGHFGQAAERLKLNLIEAVRISLVDL
ncbi:MAG: hypothetical protein ABI401_12605 [Candidatus Dormibacter sp.]